MPFNKIPHNRVIVKAGELWGILLLYLRNQLVNGRYISDFEAEFARYIGVEFSIALSSGRLGLRLILESLELDKGDEVIMPAYTFYAVRETIEKCGLKPVLVDVNEDDCNMQVGLIEGKITIRTKAIIATHLYGNSCELNRISEIAGKYNLFVIEDCAQALGAQYCGRRVGSYGDFSFFSLESVKPFHTFGGGVIATNNPLLYAKLRNLVEKLPRPSCYGIFKKINFTIIEAILTCPFFFSVFVYPILLGTSFLNKDLKGIAKKTKNKFKIFESKYSNFQAYIGLQKLRDLDKLLNKRIANAKLLISGLRPGIFTQEVKSCLKPIFYYLVLKSGNACMSSRILLRKGIDVDSNLVQKCSEFLAEEEYPITCRISKATLLIPVYPQLSNREIRYVCKIINQVFSE